MELACPSAMSHLGPKGHTHNAGQLVNAGLHALERLACAVEVQLLGHGIAWHSAAAPAGRHERGRLVKQGARVAARKPELPGAPALPSSGHPGTERGDGDACRLSSMCSRTFLTKHGC